MVRPGQSAGFSQTETTRSRRVMDDPGTVSCAEAKCERDLDAGFDASPTRSCVLAGVYENNRARGEALFAKEFEA